MQKRAEHKYHSGGLWSNACCGHPMPQENTTCAAKRRLFEELGIHGIDLIPSGTTMYRLNLSNGLIEHEWNQVFMAEMPEECRDEMPLTWVITPNPEEVDHWKWMALEELTQDLVHHPHSYSPWLPHVLQAACLM